MAETEKGVRPRVLVVEDDATTQKLLRAAFGRVRAETVAVFDCAGAAAALSQGGWSAMLVDLNLPDGSGFDVVRRIRAAGLRIPVIVLSGTSDFAAKIEALRAGADAYHEKNGDWHALAAQVMMMVRREEGARILIVEDDRPTANVIAAMLRRAGYSTFLCSDARQFEAKLVECTPHLVLMDIGLPYVDGFELTRFLRQDERFETTPVVYLTALNRDDPSLRAALAGGERILRKPVAADVLLPAVASSLEHFRRLRSLLEHDALTGVLTRRALLERAASIATAAACDGSREHSLAMIDIDHFKDVNDRYGHPAGDRVLVMLAEALRQGVGEAGVVGRYGGEEFVVIVNADESAAVLAIDRILNQFRLVQHRVTPLTTIGVTFSAGVAAMGERGENVAEWIARADRALYRAKAQGRNRVFGCNDHPVEFETRPVVDAATIAELRSLGSASGHDVLREVAELFLAVMPERLQTISGAVEHRDAGALRRESHALRGAAGSTGLPEVMASCAALENIGRDAAWEFAPMAFDRLCAAYLSAREALLGLLDGT